MEPLNEAILIEGAKRGERASQEAIVRLYERRVFGLVLRMVENREDARDVVQDSMVKALTGIGRYEGTSSFVTWLFRIATNTALDLLRRRKLEYRIFRYESDETREGPVIDVDDAGRVVGVAGGGVGIAGEAPGHSNVDCEVVARCMETLPARYRTVLHLRYRDDLSYKEIAEVLSVPMGTVKVLIHRGHAELRKAVLAATERGAKQQWTGTTGQQAQSREVKR
jgi:RNA polymerase sigma-70 factor (ECF subfamily)